MVGERVHAHGDGEVLQVVEELAEGLELLEGDAAVQRAAVEQPVQVHVVLVRVQVRVAQQDLREVHLRDRLVPWTITYVNLFSPYLHLG